ncbi:TenA family protein [Acidocella sp.]|uniref:TenA family protein n=1 Tax=Acidocella sp. TaxID=50710 RepID=UPI00260E7A2B|nr:TenA family protein [Acidocella sp.]
MAVLFTRLRKGAGAVWRGYVRHPFVEALADGTLSRTAFSSFLVQDYLFLIQYARAYALLAYKLEHLPDIQTALETARALIETEMPLHVKYCAGWGIFEVEMRAAPPALETLAYTRFVLEVGFTGDALDLLVALAPCIAGYAQIGAWAAAQTSSANPYQGWINTYTGEDYLKSVDALLAMIDRVGAALGAEARWSRLQDTFTQATRLETAFWNTGWALQN